MTENVVNNVVETLKSNIHGLSEQKLTDLIYTAIQSCAGLHIIIDGLDECERNAQQEITKTLYRLLTVGRPIVKVLVTCREEGHLLTGFSDFCRLHISVQASAADIESYICDAIASSLLSGDLALRNPALKGEIISKLVNKAQGMYVSYNEAGLFERRLLMLSGFSGYISKSTICATPLPMKAYAKFSTICRMDCTTPTQGSS